MFSELKPQRPLLVAMAAATAVALLAPEGVARIAVICVALCAFWSGFTAVFFAALLVRPLRVNPAHWCPPVWGDVIGRSAASVLACAGLGLVQPRLVVVVACITVGCALLLAAVAHGLHRPRPKRSSRSTLLRGTA